MKTLQEQRTESVLKMQERIIELEKENAELKLKLEALEGQTPWKDIKDKSEVIGQLTKAKEIIKTFSEFVNNEIEYVPEHPQEYTDLWSELCEKAEQFLSEVEK